MDTYKLKKWILENNIQKRTIEGFWDSFNTYKVEEQEEFNKSFETFDEDLITLTMSKIRLSIRNWDTFEAEYNENTEFVEAYINIEYKGDVIGYFSALYNYNGQSFDEYLVWQWKTWYENALDEGRNQRENEVVKAALKNGVDILMISKITGLSEEQIKEVKDN